VERVLLKAVLALCIFVSLMLSACSEEPNRPDREQPDRPDRAQKDAAPEETTMTVEQPAKPPEGVKSFEVGPGGMHTEGDVDYAQSPPVGGEHNPIWQNCGFYDEPVRDVYAVHSLEHGAVWITYSPDLPQDEIERLRDLVRTLAQSNDYVLVSPYPDLNSAVVASAWGKQLSLESAEDPELERFIRAYVQGPQTPERDAPCYGGMGRPG
jgi:uncharacterized protein DUF3105